MTKQVEKTQQATITGLSHEGRGIAQIDGKAVFISGALPGESVHFNYLRRRNRYDNGYATEILQASPERVAPKCQHYDICGGCGLQHLAPSSQILAKEAILREQLQHIGKVSVENWLPPLTGPTWGYRHKARLGVRYVEKKGEVLIGFREKNHPRFIANMQQCEVLHPSIGHNITPLKTLFNTLDNKRHVPQIEIAVGDDASALIIRHLQDFSDSDTVTLIDFAKQQNYHLYLQPGGPASVHRIWPTEGPELLHYHLPDEGLELQFHPTDFTQINAKLNQKMVNQALQLLALDPNDTVLDLFCGLGNFTLPIAKHCKSVLGVEGDERMVRRAQNNALHNKIDNTQFLSADLSDFSSTTLWPQQKFAKILIDPPRTGALAIIQNIDRFAAQRIVYVSCNPATLARDAGELVNKHHYRLTAAGVMDMFPHTTHVESIALFERK